MDKRKVLELEEGWKIIQKGITRTIGVIEGFPESPPIDAETYMNTYTTVYNMCTHRPPHDYGQQLYERYEGVCNSYLKSIVLPSIQEKHDDDDVSMLQEVVKRWANHKVLVNWLLRYFSALDRHYINPPFRGSKLQPLKAVGFNCFRKIVGEEMKVRVKDAVIRLINGEREGEEIDQTLIKNVLQIFVELGNTQNKVDDSPPTTSQPITPLPRDSTSPPCTSLTYYVNDFETAFLSDTTDYYTKKASNWIKEEYVVKAEECLQKEKDRASRYLHSSTEEKLLKTVQDVLNNTASTVGRKRNAHDPMPC
ncbi:hypothetical protein MKW92_032574 [Papaver armeniacum]|nr:hypothetical protein MKW92_032574 [Papaver armeniacum]